MLHQRETEPATWPCRPFGRASVVGIPTTEFDGSLAELETWYPNRRQARLDQRARARVARNVWCDGHEGLEADAADPARAVWDNDTRARLWNAKRAASSLMPLGDSLRWCGRRRFAAAVGVWAEPATDSTPARGYCTGLARCGRNGCPTCTPNLQRTRAVELTRTIANRRAAAIAAGAGDPREYMVTVTLRHHDGVPLGDLLYVLNAAWRRVQQGKGWQLLKAKYGIVALVRGADDKVGRNGWHPHHHVIVMTDRPWREHRRRRVLNDAGDVKEFRVSDREEFRSALFVRWLSAIRKVAPVQVLEQLGLPSYERAIQVTECHDQDYIAKMGLAAELTLQSFKTRDKAKSGQRTPLQLLDDLARLRKPRDAALSREYFIARRGTRWLTYSRSLRACRDAPAASVPVSDQLALALAEGAQPMAWIGDRLYDQLKRGRYAVEPWILQHAEAGGFETLRAAIVTSLGATHAHLVTSLNPALPEGISPVDVRERDAFMVKPSTRYRELLAEPLPPAFATRGLTPRDIAALLLWGGYGGRAAPPS